MKKFSGKVQVILLLSSTICLPFCAKAQVDVLTYHNNNQRTGENLRETILTPANVNARSFGKLFSYSVDGHVYAQPLYVSSLYVAGQGTHNAVFVATQHNSVYAFDADQNTGASSGLLWHANLGPSAATPNPDFGNRYGAFDDIVPEVGITSTPVIDLGSGTLYVDAFTHEGAAYYHRIHALDISSGTERSFSPVVVSASVRGQGVGSANGILRFDAKQHIQRSALTLAGGILYVAYAGYADTDPFHGWVIGFSAGDLRQLPNYVFNSTPNSTVAKFGQNAGEGGIWMSGCGLSVDDNLNLYLATGNGSFNALNGSGGTEYGDSFLKLSTRQGLFVVDYFTPHNQAFLAANNIDVDSGGVLLLPDQPGPYSHLMIGGVKAGQLYLMNRDALTTGNNHYNPSSSQDYVLQTISANGGVFATPAYLNGTIYLAAAKDRLAAWSLSNGLFSTAPTSVSGRVFGYPGATPSVSANAMRDGIVWAVARSTSALLTAYNSTNLAVELYNSAQAGARDRLTGAVKFAVPTIANGKVYVGSQDTLTVFGLLAKETGSALPVGTYSGLFNQPSAVDPLTSGSFTASTSRRGTYSGKLQIGASRYSFGGRLDSLGSATFAIPRKADTPLNLSFKIDDNRLTGTVGDGSWLADLVANRAIFNARTNPAPFSGKYTLILPGSSDGNPQNPQGDGYGMVSVNQAGQVRFVGALADGTKVAQAATISQDGSWPFYFAPYHGQGEILGWLGFSDRTPIGGQMHWNKIPNSRDTYYADGFNLNPTATGSVYQPPLKNAAILNFSDGLLMLTGESLDGAVVNYVTVNANYRVINLSSNRVTLALNPSTGLFRGTLINPADRKSIAVSGALLQQQNAGWGYFLRQNQSGRVYFGPR